MSSLVIEDACKHSLPKEKVNLIISETEKKEILVCSDCIKKMREFCHYVLEKKS